jgi:hypothetical protein
MFNRDVPLAPQWKRTGAAEVRSARTRRTRRSFLFPGERGERESSAEVE